MNWLGSKLRRKQEAQLSLYTGLPTIGSELMTRNMHFRETPILGDRLAIRPILLNMALSSYRLSVVTMPLTQLSQALWPLFAMQISEGGRCSQNSH